MSYFEIENGTSRPSANELERRAHVAAAADADGSGMGDSSFSALIELFRSDFTGSLVAPDTKFLAEEIFDWFAERGLLANSRRNGSHGDSASRGHKLAAIAIKLFYYLKDAMEGAGGTKVATAFYAALHVWDLPEFDAINGHLNTSEFARTVIARWAVTKDGRGRKKRVPVYLTKQAVNNAVMDAQKHFQLPPRRDQRGDDARANMSASRTGQLDNNGHKKSHNSQDAKMTASRPPK
jgi:hypothetical protein